MARRKRAAFRGVVAACAGLVGMATAASCSQINGLVGEREAEARTATVAVLVSAGGDVNSTGVEAAVNAAVTQATDGLDGWDVTVQVVPEGDQPTATTEALQELLDEDLIAVVGGLSTPAVRSAQAVLDPADVIFVSPADVRPEHTRGADLSTPLRPYESYFRTGVTDADPVVEALRYAAAVHGVDAVAVIDTDGGSEPGRGTAAAEAAGVPIAAAEPDDDDDADDGTAAAARTGPISGAADLKARVVAASKTEASGIYLAADPSRAPAVLAELASAAPEATVVGGAAFAEDAPPKRNGFSGPLLRALPPELPTTMNAVPDGLAEALDGSAPGRYGAAAYDAGLVVGTVLTSCLPSASSASDARTGCLGEMDQTRVTGLTGDVTFDAFGDRAGATIRVQAAENNAWTTVSGG